MLKHSGAIVLVKDSLITVQDNTMLKPIDWNDLTVKSLITVQDNTMLKHQYVQLT